MSVTPGRPEISAPFRLLLTKLFVPRAHPEVVDRPWLDQRLKEGLDRKVTVLSAPAGFGKTTLISRWVNSIQCPVAWFSIDEGDNDPTRFWSYFIAAIQTQEPEIGKTALALLWSPQPPLMETVLTELLNEISTLTAKTKLLLVLDDYHLIETSSIHTGLTYILENLPPTISLILAGRSEPPLPIALLRGQRELTELHPGDLRFTKQETEIFLNRIMQLGLSLKQIAALDEMAEGWAAGLQLAAMTLEAIRNDPTNEAATPEEEFNQFQAMFSGSHRYVFDYLAQEVVDRQPIHVRSFLLHTAILERLNSSLCDALVPRETGGGPTNQAILEYLEMANLFILPLDSQRHWYRYHHLFASFLRTLLEQEYSKELIKDLHRKASKWYIQNGYPHEAIQHALASQDHEHAASLISSITQEMFNTSQIITVKNWLAMLPVIVVSQDARLSMVYAWARLATGEVEFVENHLEDVEQTLGASADGSENSFTLPAKDLAILGEICSIRASLAFNRNDLSAVLEYCRLARKYVTQDIHAALVEERNSTLGVIAFNEAVANEYSGLTIEARQAFEEAIRLNQYNPHLLPLATGHLAGIQILQGQLRRAETTYQKALLITRSQKFPSPLSAMVQTGLGNLLCEWNRLEQALIHLIEGIELGRKWNQWESLVHGYLGLARLYWAQSDVDAAFRMLEEIKSLAEDTQVVWANHPVRAYHALLSARSGDLDTASAWAEASPLTQGQEIKYIHESDALTLTRIYLAQNRLDKAASLAADIVWSAETGGRYGRVIEACLLQALSLYLQGSLAHATPVLNRALNLAAPEKYQRVFFDEGPSMGSLLYQVKAAGLITRPDQKGDIIGYLDDLIRDFNVSNLVSTPGMIEMEGVLIEPLSERELEVMRLIVSGLTNQEISEELFISVNTVKSHIKNIYKRMEVSNRAQAIARWRQLGFP